MPILKTDKCYHCANRQYEKKHYDSPIEIPCLLNKLENRDLKTCPHFEKYVPLKQRRNCPNCGANSNKIKHYKIQGERVCLVCGCVVDEKTWGQVGKGTRSSGYNTIVHIK